MFELEAGTLRKHGTLHTSWRRLKAFSIRPKYPLVQRNIYEKLVIKVIYRRLNRGIVLKQLNYPILMLPILFTYVDLIANDH